MHIRIYFDEKPVFLCDAIDGPINEILHHPDAIFIDELSNSAINSLLHEIKKEEFHTGVILHHDLEKLKKIFFKHFTSIEASGGIVQNENKELLFIFRLGKWDLPKGKLEKGEDVAQCAVREVEEETGATNLTLKNKIAATYHVYHAFGKHFIKTTHWFYITCTGVQQLIPQTEEDITAIKWIAIKNIDEPLLNTYSNIKNVIAIFLGKD